jgi:hypothetical protein
MAPVCAFVVSAAVSSGTVKELSTTTVAAVVQPGSVLLTLLPAHESGASEAKAIER